MSDDNNKSEIDDLDNLGASNTSSETEFDEFDDALSDLNEDTDSENKESEVNVLEDVEDNNGLVVDFEEEEDDDEPVKKSNSKARLAILGTASILFVGGAVFIGGTSIGLFSGSPSVVKKETVSETTSSLIADVDANSGLNSDFIEDTELKPNNNPKDNVSDLDVVVDVSDSVKDEPLSIKEALVVDNSAKEEISSAEDDFQFLNSKPENEIASVKPAIDYSKDIDEIKTRLLDLEKISSLIESQNGIDADRFDILISKINKVSDISRKSNIVTVEKELPRLSLGDKMDFIKGRERLSGYNVIATSRDGTMSIIRSLKYSKERVSVFFKGEDILVSGEGAMKVTGIEDSGHLTLVGSKYYIDDTYVPFTPSKSSSSSASKSKEVGVAKKEVSKPITKEVKRTVKESSPVANVKYKTVAKGWKMNGVYTNSFLIESPTGDWSTKVVGDTIKGLGIVSGLDKRGDLIVGDYVIKMISLSD